MRSSVSGRKHVGGCAVLGVGDALMPGPAAFVFGDQPAGAEHAHPLEVGDHLDPATDRGRVDGVVVAVQTDVVITRQPHRHPPPVIGVDRRQRQHRLLIGMDALERSAADRAVLTVVRADQPGRSWVLKSPGELNVRPGRKLVSK